MAKKKLTIDDIFNDDDFGLLDSKAKTSTIKTDEDRLIDSFEEINVFFDKNNREPNSSSMSEYGLLAKLKNFRQNEKQKKTLNWQVLIDNIETEVTTKLSILTKKLNYNFFDPTF